jgi:hypothetical protein
MRKKFDTEYLGKAFEDFKLDQTKDNLDTLYEGLDKIVLTVTNNISKRFRAKNFSDFEDLQQTVRLDIYRYLPRILESAFDPEQLVRIVVAASVIRFRFAYMNFLKKTPVSVDVTTTNISSWQPKYNVPVFLVYENWSAEFEKQSCANPNQLYLIYLKSLKVRILDKVKQNNRFKEQENLVCYYVDCLLKNISPSKDILKNIFKTNKNYFWTKYSEVLMRVSLMQVLKEDKLNFITE